MSLLTDAGSTPRSKKLLPILISTGLNAFGGVVAQKVEKIGKDAFQKYALGGDLLVIMAAAAAKYGFSSGSGTVELVVREIGAGMAGYSGADLFQGLKDKIGWGVDDYKAGTPYKLGAKVRYASKTWKANTDIAASEAALPGSDPRWVPAQGIDPEMFREVTGHLLRNDQFVSTIAHAQAALMTPEIDRLVKEGKIVLDGPGAGDLAQAMVKSLRNVAAEFHRLGG